MTNPREEHRVDDVDGLLALLDTVSERANTLGELAGEHGAAQEDRAINRGRAHLARAEARQIRDDVAEVRRRAREIAAQARTARADAERPDAASAHVDVDVLAVARSAVPTDTRPLGTTPQERLVEQARHVAGSVGWAQLFLPGTAGRSSGELPPALVATLEEGPRAAVLAGVDAVLVDEGDDHWTTARSDAARAGVGSVLGLAVPAADVRGVLLLASAESGTFAAGAPGRAVAEVFVEHVARTLGGDAGAARHATRDVLDAARAVLGRHFGVGDDATFDAMLEVARRTGEPVVAVAERLLDALVPDARGLPATNEPAVLRHAVAYIDGNAGRDVGLEDIAGAAGIGERRLQQLFRRHRGCTPLEYLRRVRLDHAHADLEALDAESGTTVADVAIRWHFTHPGRFSALYRERFGRVPSVTLRA